ncbi:MAG: hypothetical protein ACTTKL_06560 [Treponema sp.]
MNICPKVIHIRNSQQNEQSAFFQPDRICLKKTTVFGFKEFVSHFPQGLDIQCLFCSSYKPDLCSEQWFEGQALNKICDHSIISTSNFHLCLKLPKDKHILYIYFQKRSEKLNQSIIENEFKAITSLNCHALSDTCIVILLCGFPCFGTNNIAAQSDININNEKIYLYTEQARSEATCITFAPPQRKHECCIHIECS